MKKQIVVLCMAGFFTTHTHMSAMRAFDSSMAPVYWVGQEKQFWMFTAFGTSTKGRNAAGTVVPDTQYLSAEQNGLAMLKGSPTTSEPAQVAQQINVDDDDGVRGHYVVTGDFAVPVQWSLGARYHFFNEWAVSAHVSLINMECKNIVWSNKTKNITADDALTRALLTDNFFNNVAAWGDGLNLQDWNKRGLSDTTVMLSWNRRFLQNKEWLKEVGVRMRIGLTLPTGVKKDEDKAFSVSFGNDGAYALPFGAGLDLRFKNLARAGVDVSFEHIFSHTKNRRIMTDSHQTNYLYLTKTETRKEYGVTQMFNLYIEPQLPKGFALRLAYQHTKHNDDELFVLSSTYSSITANKASSLKEWTTHHLITQLKWDAQKAERSMRFMPQFSVFLKTPFNGKRSLQTTALGFSCSIGF